MYRVIDCRVQHTCCFGYSLVDCRCSRPPPYLELFTTCRHVPQYSNGLHGIPWTGRFDEMMVVLRRITNAPVYISSDEFEKPRSVRRTSDVVVTSVWSSWRDTLGRLYVSVPTSTSEDVVRSGTYVSTDEDGLNASHGRGRSMSFDSGVMRVVCPGNDRALRRSVVVLVVVWFTISYGTYGVATWNNQLFANIGLSNPYLCSLIYALSSLPGNVGSILLVERVRSSYHSSHYLTLTRTGIHATFTRCSVATKDVLKKYVSLAFC